VQKGEERMGPIDKEALADKIPEKNKKQLT